MAPKRKEKSPMSSAPPMSPRRTRSSTAAAGGVKILPEDLSSKNQNPSEKVPKPDKKKAKTALEVVEEPPATSKAAAIIIIEACKQCQSFKRTAEKVKEGLVAGFPDIVVQINPEKPRKGCFEVRAEEGEIFVSLLNMPRPFKKMKELDLEKVVSDILVKIK